MRNYYYVTLAGEPRGKFSVRKNAQRWADAFLSLSEDVSITTATTAIADTVSIPQGKCRYSEGEIPLGAAIALTGEEHPLWEVYMRGFNAGHIDWDDDSPRPRHHECPYKSPSEAEAWKAGWADGSAQARMDE
jgi:ribosome modulation factor